LGYAFDTVMTDNKKLAWIETYTGKKFHILEPSLDEIDIEDIAHSLSMQCRWTGMTRHFYSVSQHSYYVSWLVPSKFALDGLLHDASESYLGDLNRPVKHHTETGQAYIELEETIQKKIGEKFGLTWPIPDEVHKADRRMLFTEKEQLMGNLVWDTTTGDAKTADIKIGYLAPPDAEAQFLLRFKDLTGMSI
jgi:hypothetical protein